MFRSYILLLGGLAVIGWEVIAENSERPTIIIAALLMMGISVPLNLDEKAKWLATLSRGNAQQPQQLPTPDAPPQEDAKTGVT